MVNSSPNQSVLTPLQLNSTQHHASASRSMCHQDIFIYRECCHRKTVEVTPCDRGYNAAAQRCNFNVQQGKIRYQPYPCLCPPCYRKVEEEICDRHDEKLLYIQANVRRLRDLLTTLERELDVAKQNLVDDSQPPKYTVADQEEMVANVVCLIERSKEKAEENRKSRRSALKAFRDKQKVWGDG